MKRIYLWYYQILKIMNLAQMESPHLPNKPSGFPLLVHIVMDLRKEKLIRCHNGLVLLGISYVIWTHIIPKHLLPKKPYNIGLRLIGTMVVWNIQPFTYSTLVFGINSFMILVLFQPKNHTKNVPLMVWYLVPMAKKCPNPKEMLSIQTILWMSSVQIPSVFMKCLWDHLTKPLHGLWKASVAVVNS